MASVFDPVLRNQGKLLGGIGGDGRGSVREAPADLVALGGGTQFALLALGRGLKCAAAAHFFEDALGIQLGLEALESPIDRLAFFHGHSTHALIGRLVGLVPQVVRGAVNAGSVRVCQHRTRRKSEKRGACYGEGTRVLSPVLRLLARNCADRPVKHPAASGFQNHKSCIVFPSTG